MRNLRTYPGDPFEAFQRIIKSKRGNRKILLQSITDEIQQHYESYFHNRSKLEMIAPHKYQGDLKDALLHCYESDTNDLNKLVATIRQIQHDIRGTSNRCQYCSINVDSTVDHYLPKEIYPEFAVYAFNLIPCCSECNIFKGTKFMLNGKRQFVNFYFDNLPTQQFLRVELKFKDGIIPVPNYYIQRTPDISSEIIDIIDNHFKWLELSRRYSECTELITEHISSIQNNGLEGDAVRISELLHDEADRQQKAFGLNFWRFVLTNELAESAHFITKTIPAIIADPTTNLFP